ncbi:MAG TPA: rhomboid family intramembrane serine protease [Gemmatimonadaceae bacterium]
MTRVVRTLLFANVIAFFLQQTQPALTNAFAFVPYLAWERPWTFVTYMFLHGSLMHIGFNMLGLWFFGSGVETRLGSARFTWLYFLSGISGALLSMVLSPSAAVIGASAGVYGVMLAFARFWPDTIIMIWGFIPVPARILVILTTVMSIWAGFGGMGGDTAHFAHLGGFVGAWLYLKWHERKRAGFRKRAVGGTREVLKRVESYSAIDLSRVHEVNRDEVGRLLDKAAKGGVGALTPEERAFLSNFVPKDVVPPVT